MIHKTSLLCASLLALLVFPLPARGAPPPVTISVSGCRDLSQAEVERILNIELRTIARGRKEVRSAPTHVSVQCADQTIALEAHVSGKAAVHTDRLNRNASGNRDGAERLVAIAAAELIFSAWVALLPPQKAVPGSNENEVQPPPKKRREEKDETNQIDQTNGQKKNEQRRIGLALGVGPSWRMYIVSRAHLFGGELGLSLFIFRMFYLRIGGTVEGGKARRRIGEVSLFAASGICSLGLELTFAHAAASLEAGGRFGGGTLKGASNRDDIRPETVKGGVGGPLMRLGFRTVTKVSAGLAMEAGYAVYGNTGRVADDNPVHMKGVYLSAALMIVFNLV